MSLLSRNKSNQIVGLDVDGAFLAAAQTDGRKIGRLGSMDLPEGVTRDGEVTDPDALAEYIKELFAEHKLGRTVRLGVANTQIVLRHLDMPVIADDKQRDAAIRFQAAEAIAMPLDQAVLDYQPVGAFEVDGSPRQRFLVVAARRSMVDQLLSAVKLAGLKAEGIDLNAFALVRALTDGAAPAVPGEVDHRAICHLGGVTNLAIAMGSTCVFARALSTPWRAGDPDVAASVAEEVRLSLDYHRAQAGSEPISELLLSGPGAADAVFADGLSERIMVPVRIADPLELSGLPAGEDASRYTVAAGLAMGGQYA